MDNAEKALNSFVRPNPIPGQDPVPRPIPVPPPAHPVPPLPQPGPHPVPPPAPPTSSSPLAADGSVLTVVRNDSGQVAQASGTGRDGVARRITIASGSRIAVQGKLLHWSEILFYSNNKLALTMSVTSSIASFSTDYAFRASDGSQLACIVAVNLATSQATIITSTGVKQTVALTGSSLSSLTGINPVALPGLTPAIKQALTDMLYFNPLFQQEYANYQTQAEGTLNKLNLTMHQPPNMTLPALWKARTSSTSTRADSVHWWQSTAWGLGSVLGGAGCAALGLETLGLGCLGILFASGFLANEASNWLGENPPTFPSLPDDPDPDYTNDLPGGTPDPIGGWTGGDGGSGYGGDGGEGGGEDGGGCFVRGTVVTTAHGFLPIDQIQVADSIYALDCETGEKSTRPVVRVFESWREEILVLDFGTERIRCTPPHRFYTGTWVPASQLQPGACVLNMDGEWKELFGVQREIQPQSVFNLRVEALHNYFVGHSRLLVHNDKKQDGGTDDDPIGDQSGE